ncbi:MAG: hypothetical protein ABIY55_35630 [Kofleriaceae bacterium]
MLVLALGASTAATADPKRSSPDYDGRGNEDADDGSWALWIPRVVLSPLYLVNEYVLRRPIGTLIEVAERDRWIETVSDAFTFGPQNNYVLAPTALFDFGLSPSIGLYFAGDNTFAAGNSIKLHAATWGPRQITATALDRYAWNAGRSVLSARVDFNRTQDSLFLGLGPDVTDATRSRYGLRRLDTHVSFKQSLAGESTFSVYGGVRTTGVRDGACCGDPALADLIADGSVMPPPGFGEDYTTIYQRVGLTLDSRKPRPAPATGGYLSLAGQPSFDLHHARSWIRYGGVLGGIVDVDGHQHAIGLKVGVDLVDQLQGRVVPFTELPSLGSDLMPGFVDGWMIGQSTTAAQLSYTWPVAVWLDGEARVSAGNAFGDHLAGFAFDKLRLSGDFGVTSTGARNEGLELLFGLGTETIEHGEHITSVRLTIGSRRGF